MKKILVFDTETTGLPADWNAPATDVKNWPRLVQLAYQLYREDSTLEAEGNIIVVPEGFVIPEEAAKIHGITTEKAVNDGEYLKDVLTEFYQTLFYADVLVAHNMAFDEKIVGAEFVRKSIFGDKSNEVMDLRPKVCTMLSSIEVLGTGKWPKLSELHVKLFGEDFENAHDAFVDTKACARCFFKLLDRGIIKL